VQDHAECLQLAQDDVNSKDPRGYTTLMHASTHGHANIVLLLIAQKANVNLKCNAPFGSTALIIACDNNRIDCVRLLLAVDGIEVNATDNKKNTALMQASRKGHLDCVQLLLQCKDRLVMGLK
jgi:ankyrin repeat protein